MEPIRQTEGAQPAPRPSGPAGDGWAQIQPAPEPSGPPAAGSGGGAGAPGRFARLAGGIGRHKKALILLGAALLGAAGLAAWRIAGSRAARPDGQPADGVRFVRTVTLEKTSLQNTVSASGTVESANVSTVTTPLSYTVKTVEVQVGDEVQAGDVICTLDTEELERQIAKREEAAARAAERAQKTLDEAQAGYDEAVRQQADAEAAHASAEAGYRAAWGALNAAADKISHFTAAYEEAYAALQTALGRYNETYSTALETAAGALAQATARREQAEAALQAALAQQAADGAAPGEGQAAELEALRLALEAAQAEEAAAQAALDAAGDGAAGAKAAYEQAQQNERAAADALSEAKRACGYDALEAEKNARTQALEAAANALDSAAARVENAQKALDEARAARSEAGEDDELEQLRQTLADCVLTAKTSGTVTGLDATVGSKCSGAVATIQDTGALKVAFTLAEYDVGNVAVGMSARITSDATSQPVDGRLTQVSPTTAASAGSGSAGGSGSSGFSAEVTVTGDAAGLRIGMNAKVEIIQSTAEDVFVVPYDAVAQAEDGSRYVLVRTGGEGADAGFEPVTVTTGAENDYYIEIRGETLREGMVVRASALEESDETAEEDGEAAVFGPGISITAGEAPAGPGGFAPADGGQPAGGMGGGMGGPGGMG